MTFSLLFPRKGKTESLVLTALWGIPSLLTLMEAYRLSGLPRLQDKGLWEGPAGYMTAIGILLIGFPLWEVIGAWRQAPAQAPSPKKEGKPLSGKIYLTVIYMLLFLTLVPFLGFILASGCFLTGAMRLLGCTVQSILITVCVYSGSLYWMVPLLGLSLPRGFLGF